jgi:diamine N-acetyltransferase
VRSVRVVSVDASNWSDALDVEVSSSQLPMVASHQPVALEILAKAYLRPEDDEWEPLAVVDESGATVGVLALVHSEGSCQIRHFAIDVRHQNRGFGRLAMSAIIEYVQASRPLCSTMVVTFHPENDPARRLYLGAGFAPTGVQGNGEPVCTLILQRSGRHE